jgi:hypothetical protein
MKQPMSEVTVYIEDSAWAKLRHWVKLAGNDEVSCLGLVEEIKNGNGTTALLVSDIYLLEQEVSGADTELNDKAVADLLIQLATEGLDTSRLKCWIHSHSTMKTFWSGTDDDCCSQLANNSYTVSIVTNLRGDLLTRIDLYHPFRITLNDVPTRIHCSCSKELEELYTAEFESKIKRWKGTVKTPKRFQSAAEFQTEEELEEAFEQGYINMYEYQQLSGQSIFDDL